MKLKFSLILLSAFIIIFLVTFSLWPSTKYDEAGCGDINTDSTYDCEPPEVFGKMGGGFGYVSQIISSGALVQPTIGRYDLYIIDSFYFFRPLQALGGAFIASSIATAVIYLFIRTKKDRIS